MIFWIRDLCDFSNTKDGVWIEPFMGSGCVGFNMKYKNAIMNDINPHIVKFYDDIKNKIITTEAVGLYLKEEGEKLLNSGDDGYEHYRFIRDRFNNDHGSLDFLFLSRTGFNGMMRFNSKGRWNVPFCQKPDRFRREHVTRIVNQVRDVSAIITDDWRFYNKDFREIILLANENDLVYVDPPYFGKFDNYFNSGWSEKDEKDLFDLLDNSKSKFIMSTWHHDAVHTNPMIGKYWNKFNVFTCDHFYHLAGNADNRHSVVEALICNFDAEMEQHNHGREIIEQYDLGLDFNDKQ